MYVTWLGLNSFRIQTSDCALVTDPYSLNSGLKLPRFQTDIVTVSQTDNPLMNNVDGLGGKPYQITGPGEYEIKKIFIRGIGENDKPDSGTLYYYEVENVRLAHCGALRHPLSTEQLELFEDIDVLFVPVGNPKAIGVELLAKLINELEPRLVIPMYFKIPGLKTAAEPLQAFLKEMGGQKPEELPKLKIIKRDLPQEETKIVVLQP